LQDGLTANASARQFGNNLARRTLTLENDVAAELAGSGDVTLKTLRQQADVEVHLRGNVLTLEGEESGMDDAAKLIDEMVGLIENGHDVEPATVDSVRNAIQSSRRPAEMLDDVVWRHRNTKVSPKTVNQKVYVDSIREHTITFGIGPAGTGKTFLAVAHGAAMLMRGDIDRLIVTRPAVEAGERLGFLPGDLTEKVDPYMAPVWEALTQLMGAEQLRRRRDKGEIEVAPIAFMRGRTLAHAFVIVDEAQNTSRLQMKMVLTRLGEGSRMAVTGDPSQIDLMNPSDSGLAHAVAILEDVEGVSVTRFTADDVIRHPMVARIVRAYDADAAKRTGH